MLSHDEILAFARVEPPALTAWAWSKSIAVKVGVHSDTVMSACRCVGLKPRVTARPDCPSVNDAMAARLYDELPCGDGIWSWYAAMAAALGVSSGTVRRWHQITGRPPRVQLPTRCRDCGAPLDPAWAALVASRFCRPCCVAHGRNQ